jgi:hypothetical protein
MAGRMQNYGLTFVVSIDRMQNYDLTCVVSIEDPQGNGGKDAKLRAHLCFEHCGPPGQWR